MRAVRSLLPVLLTVLTIAAAPARAGQPAHREDVVVGVSPDLVTPYAADIVYAQQGVVFAAVQVNDATHGPRVRLYRSVDHGAHWALTETFQDADGDPSTGYMEPSLYMGGGSTYRLYVAMRHDIVFAGTPLSAIEVQYADVSDGLEGPFTSVIAILQSGYTLRRPSLAASGLVLVVGCEGNDGSTSAIWMARSVDRAASWGAAYTISSTSSLLAGRRNVRLTGGPSGWVHAVWTNSSLLGAASVSYRRATNYAASLADWLPTATVDDSCHTPSVAAASNGRVLVGVVSTKPGQGQVFVHYENNGASANAYLPTTQLGAPDVQAVSQSRGWYSSHHGAGGQVVVAFHSNAANPAIVSRDTLSDHGYPWTSNDRIALALSLNLMDLPGALWLAPGTSGNDSLLFDAGYRRHSGFGSYTTRVALGTWAQTPPTLANLDDDPALEIAFADSGGNVRVLNGNGAALAGWPRAVGPIRPRASVCVGDVDADGQNDVVIGTAGGGVWAFDRTGQSLPGFPKTVNLLKPCWVSLADLAGDSRLEIVACAGNQVHVLDAQASELPGFPAFTTANVNIPAPAAIGDVDGDGSRDLVVLSGAAVRWFRADGTLGALRTIAGEQHEGPPALADVDGNGDLEVLVSSPDGVVHLMDHAALADRAGWPVVSAPGNRTGAIFGQFDDTDPFGVAWADTSVHVVGSNGQVPPLYTAEGDPPSPLAGLVAGELNGNTFEDNRELAYGDESLYQHVLGTHGVAEFGWPLKLFYTLDYDNGIGDVDGDGHPELVVLARGALHVYDVVAANESPSAPGSWPQYGYDATHDFCFRCTSTGTTGVPETPGAALRLGAPTPNPSRGPAAIAFALAKQGAVSLDVYDLGGRHVRALASGRHGPGTYTMTWDGRDGSGAPVRPGVYLVRLRQDGVGTASGKLVRIE